MAPPISERSKSSSPNSKSLTESNSESQSEMTQHVKTGRIEKSKAKPKIGRYAMLKRIELLHAKKKLGHNNISQTILEMAGVPSNDKFGSDEMSKASQSHAALLTVFDRTDDKVKSDGLIGRLQDVKMCEGAGCEHDLVEQRDIEDMDLSADDHDDPMKG